MIKIGSIISIILNLLRFNQLMHNLYAIFGKFLEITKQKAGNLVNEKVKVNHRGAVSRFYNL